MRTTSLMSLFVAMTLVISGCSGADSTATKDDEKPTAIAVEAVAVSRGELVAHYTATAALEAEQSASVVAELAGTVLSIDVEEGQTVRKGQVLARLDADRSRLSLRQSEAELQRLKNDVDRNGRLIERKLIAANTYDQAQSEFLARQADTAIARMTVRKSEIRAPFDGVVTRRWIKRGQFMASNALAFDIADFGDLKTRLSIPERDAAALKVGQTVRIDVDAFPGQRFDGVIERIAPVVDQASGTIAVTVAADNQSGKLRPGLFCRLDIAFDRIADATLLPKAAIQGGQGDSVVYVVADGKAKRTRVQLGRENGGMVQVLDGVAPGAMVVTAGQAALNDGAVIEVLGAAVAAVIEPAKATAKQ